MVYLYQRNGLFEPIAFLSFFMPGISEIEQEGRKDRVAGGAKDRSYTLLGQIMHVGNVYDNRAKSKADSASLRSLIYTKPKCKMPLPQVLLEAEVWFRGCTIDLGDLVGFMSYVAAHIYQCPLPPYALS